MRKFLPFLLVLLLLAGAAFKCNEDTCRDVCITYAVCLSDSGMTWNAGGICGPGEKYAGTYDTTCRRVCE